MRSRFRVFFQLVALPVLCCLSTHISAQMITGTWKGKINRQKVELKIIQNGDSLTGTSYYYESVHNYRRYSIKGYFDPATNAAVWWDDQLITEKAGRFSLLTPGKNPMLSRADFSCPGSNRMLLDGKTGPKENELLVKGEVHLDKTNKNEFEDEWDYVIENYLVGANDPDIIDSIGSLALIPTPVDEISLPPPGDQKEPGKTPVQKPAEKPLAKEEPPIQKTPAVLTKNSDPVKTPAIEEKFAAREKVFIKEIPVTGDTLELRFYDNAEIDGDSISLFLNDKLLYQHIRLTGNAYIIRIAVSELKENNELTMVAENMGTIPPNTSYMVAIVNEKRYDAYLASSEGSSAMIRFTKK